MNVRPEDLCTCGTRYMDAPSRFRSCAKPYLHTPCPECLSAGRRQRGAVLSCEGCGHRWAPDDPAVHEGSTEADSHR